MEEDDVRRIGDYVQPWLQELFDRMAPQIALAGLDAQLLERMVRVEEELKNQREIMDERFGAMDRRFEDMHEGFKRTQWLIGVGFVLVTTVVTIFGLIG